MPTFTITPSGPFSLRESATFGFGGRADDPSYDGVMRLAFCVDGYHGQVGVALRQPDPDGPVTGDVVGAVEDLQAVQQQVARVLSLDLDATGFVAVGDRDPVVARLLEAAPGLRPPLFYSAYEAAAWAVLSARRPGAQMQKVRAAFSASLHPGFELAGQRLAPFPLPQQLLGVTEIAGLDGRKVARLHGIAQAALHGDLDTETLRQLDPEEASARLQRLDGIGPFYAMLVVIRALGRPDVLPEHEPRLLALVGDLYDLGGPATPEQLARIATAWAPWQTWCSVLFRAAASRLT